MHPAAASGSAAAPAVFPRAGRASRPPGAGCCSTPRGASPSRWTAPRPRSPPRPLAGQRRRRRALVRPLLRRRRDRAGERRRRRAGLAHHHGLERAGEVLDGRRCHGGRLAEPSGDRAHGRRRRLRADRHRGTGRADRARRAQPSRPAVSGARPAVLHCRGRIVEEQRRGFGPGQARHRIGEPPRRIARPARAFAVGSKLARWVRHRRRIVPRRRTATGSAAARTSRCAAPARGPCCRRRESSHHAVHR